MVGMPRGEWGALATPIHTEIPVVDGIEMPWRDNAIFFWWDDDSDVYGVLHVSTSPDGGGRRARCSVTVGDRAREVIEPLQPGSFDSDSISVDLDGRLSVSSDGLSADLVLTPAFGPLDFTKPRALGAAADDHPLNHHEHPMHVEGTATLGGDAHRFSGSGWRDRSWGFRDESAQWSEYCAVTVLYPGEAMVLMKMRLVGGEAKPVGWRQTRDTGPQPITDIAITRDAAGLLAEIKAGGEDFDVELRKVRRTAGHWTPMGDGGEGPVFSAYNEFMVLERADGARAAAMCEHGILRTVS